MSNYSKSRRKTDKDSSYKSKDRRSRPKRSTSPLSKRKGSSPSRGSSSRRGKRTVSSFDPSFFMKEIEEQTATHAYVPKNLFSDFALEDLIKTNIEKKGYVAPTPIQDQTIPYILEGRDVIGAANTGTGKTAAFLIPLIHNVLMEKTSRVLIIAPTRELAFQIRCEFKSFAAETGLTSALCIGGVNINRQIQTLKSNPAFVIGTPGRLIDLGKSKIINFRDYTSIVLDEVDRMLDMGFIQDIKYIIHKLPKKRHSLFFSATVSKNLQDIMNSFLQNPISISVKTRQSAENVNQKVIRIGQQDKVDLLHDLLIKPEFTKSLIFLRTKRSVDKLAKELKSRGFVVALIHGNKTQSQRGKALLLFKTGKVTILLATDVVARGIDINDISHVINFDLPQTHDDYIHRIGRTGRADKIGHAITLV